MARNAPLATWAVNDAYDRPLRLCRPTASCPYFKATWYEPGVERQQTTTLGREESAARRWCVDKTARLTKAQRRRRPDRPLMPGRALIAEYLNLDNQPGWGSKNTVMKAAGHARSGVRSACSTCPVSSGRPRTCARRCSTQPPAGFVAARWPVSATPWAASCALA